AAGPAVLCLHSNIIDVSAADSQGMEQHEYMDRARQYRWDLPCSLGTLAAPSEPRPQAGREGVSRIAAYAFSALSQIRVDAKEELVVQFGIP
ncbi:Ragulator complex protein LAMTOR1, partial [Eudyptes chrysocome]